MYNIKKQSIFNLDFEEYTPAHCISSDYKMGAGIAVPMKNKFGLHDMKSKFDSQYPNCIYYNGVLNLVTKNRYFHKPTYETMRQSLLKMKEIVESENMTKIAMPKIGAGLDRLSWPKVEKMVKDIFGDLDIEILVCYI